MRVNKKRRRERQKKKSGRIIRRLISLMLTVWLGLGPGPARADFALPAGLTEIGEEAFQGISSLTSLEIPEGVTTVGPRAFAGCGGLNRIVIPGSVTEIGAGAFEGCGEALLIQCPTGSAARHYAAANQIDYRADTVCRALVVGQTYTGTSMALQGPGNDMQAVRFCLSGMGWTATARSNLTASELLSAIRSTFSSATEDDISLFFYAGHGTENGSLVGKTGDDFVSPQQLKSVLDEIPGRKIVIVDACYSGQLIAEEENENVLLMSAMGAATETEDHAAQFVSAFQSAFKSRLLRGALNGTSYFVITAARESEESEEGSISNGGISRTMGFFTYQLCRGLGFNGITMRADALNADGNHDQAVSIQEAYAWAAQNALAMNAGQHAAVWPSGCVWFAPFRP